MQDSINAGELDALAVLWAETNGARPALKLSEIRDLVAQRREKSGEAAPASSTLSTYLRNLVTKGLVREVLIQESKKRGATSAPVRGVRGMLPATRSPNTGYQAAAEPGEVLRQTFRALVSAYPEERRWEAVVDMAGESDLPKNVVNELERWLKARLSKTVRARKRAD